MTSVPAASISVAAPWRRSCSRIGGSPAWAARSRKRRNNQSGRSGSCFDNAVTESFFASLETELIDRTRFSTRAQAQQAVFSYIEGFYNPHRRHSANAKLSPADYERHHTAALASAPHPPSLTSKAA
ncbi:transposase InsO family protein [Lipingzhangella halophila]|uniref:Transposase InsO family protein n=1 Tax=Lipingzhangella halophila TaxID=1783352 RepID=A0A7W7RN94_9ACTN|nr:transposase InsO family protein [Lipingzhangella halophila]